LEGERKAFSFYEANVWVTVGFDLKNNLVKFYQIDQKYVRYVLRNKLGEELIR